MVTSPELVGLVLVSHSRRLAEAAVDLIKGTVAPQIPIAAAGGVGDDRSEFGTDALDIQEAILAVRSKHGVLVLMDMGSAILSAEMAKEFLGIEMSDPLVLCSAPLVEGSIAAAVQIQIGSSLAEVVRAAQEGLAPKQEHLGDATREQAHAGSEAMALPSPGEELEVVIQNEHGLHLRPAAVLIKALSSFNAAVQIENQSAKRGPTPAKSLVDLARLQIRQGDKVRFMVSGPDQPAALAAIRELSQTNFGETGGKSAVLSPIPANPSDGQPFPVSAGIAIGTPFFFDQVEPPIPSYSVTTEGAIRAEIEKLHAALLRADAEFASRYDRLRGSLDPETLAILDAQRLILGDATIVGEAESIIREKHENASQAWSTILSGLAAEQEAVADEYLRARAADFREVRVLVLSQLTDDAAKPRLPTDTPNLILVCDELTPGLAEAIQATSIEGVLQLHGGTTSHGAILARALQLPSIGGAARLADRIRQAVCIAFDGANGTVWIEPTDEKRAELELERQARHEALAKSLIQSQQPAMTRDGIRVKVAANAGSRKDIEQAVYYGAESIGLFRSEFLFQKFERSPEETEQLTAYQDALAAAGSRTVTLRLLDIGGDKPLPFLSVPHESNPFLGVRGIRLLYRSQPFLRSHLRAVLRLSASHQIRILIPMVTERAEVVTLKRLLAELREDLVREGLAHSWPIPIGTMIETPAAALLVDQLALDCDFLSLGTNDLTQYVLCAERGNPLLNAYSDVLHPAVLRICQQAIASAHSQQIPISICGEAASDPEALPVLLGLGLRDFSVTPASIPNIKSLIRRLDCSQVNSQLGKVQQSSSTAATMRSFAKAFGNEKGHT
jgi:multiphosphoryl transfer protein